MLFRATSHNFCLPGLKIEKSSESSGLAFFIDFYFLDKCVSNHLRYNVKSLNIKLSEENDGVVLFSQKVGFCQIRFELHITTSEYMSFI